MLHARGEVKPGDHRISRSIIGGTFKAEAIGEAAVGNLKAVLPRIAAPLALATVATMSGDLPPSVERQNQIDNLQRRITTREAAGKTGTSRGTPGDFTGWNTTDDLKKQLAALQGGSGSEVQAQADAIGVAVAKEHPQAT